MNSRYKLIIFDLDGTLINSVVDIAISTNYALRKLGLHEHPQDAYRYFVGNGVNILMQRVLPQEYKTDEWVERLRSEMIPHYTEHCMDNTKPYDGIREILQLANDRGILVAVASNKYQSATLNVVNHYFADIDFVSILGQRQEVPIKPDPAIIYETIDRAGVDLSEVLYVGDTAVDMQTANNAGVTAVGVSWGFRPRTELEAEKPRYIVDTREQLRDIIFA